MSKKRSRKNSELEDLIGQLSAAAFEDARETRSADNGLDNASPASHISNLFSDNCDFQWLNVNNVIEAIPIPVVICDNELRLIFFNSSAKDLLRGLGGRGILTKGRRFTELLSEKYFDADGKVIPLEENPFARALVGETCTNFILRPAIKKYPFMTLNINTAPLVDGSDCICGIIIAAQDITQHLQAHLELREVYNREHAIVDKLQDSFLVNNFPHIDGFEIAHIYHPGLDEALVGGDFYDVFKIDDYNYALVIADVAGKGLNAAIYTAMTKYMLRAYALEGSSPDIVVSKLNAALSECTPSEIFVTLLYGVIDTRTRTFTYTNAGHELPIHYSIEYGRAKPLDGTGCALALMPDSRYSTNVIELKDGDIILLYTDGITDAGSGINRFGMDAVIEIVEINASSPASELINSVLEASLGFSGGVLADDAAALVIKVCNAECHNIENSLSVNIN